MIAAVAERPAPTHLRVVTDKEGLVVDAERVASPPVEAAGELTPGRIALMAYAQRRSNYHAGRIAERRVQAGLARDAQADDYVPASSLFSDAYQRPLEDNPAALRKSDMIAEHFDWTRFNKVVVSTRGAVIDGQRRLRAAQQVLGEDVAVPIVRVPISDPTMEAALCRSLGSDRTNFSYSDDLRARIHAGDERALQLCTVLHDARLAPYLDSRRRIQDGDVDHKGCRAVESLIRAVGTTGAGVVLRTLSSAWGIDGYAYRSWVITGMFRFIASYRDLYEPKRLQEVLLRVKPRELAALCGREADGSTRAADLTRAFVRHVHALYNNGLSSVGHKRLPPLRDDREADRRYGVGVVAWRKSLAGQRGVEGGDRAA